MLTGMTRITFLQKEPQHCCFAWSIGSLGSDISERTPPENSRGRWFRSWRRWSSRFESLNLRLAFGLITFILFQTLLHNFSKPQMWWLLGLLIEPSFPISRRTRVCNAHFSSSSIPNSKQNRPLQRNWSTGFYWILLQKDGFLFLKFGKWKSGGKRWNFEIL